MCIQKVLSPILSIGKGLVGLSPAGMLIKSLTKKKKVPVPLPGPPPIGAGRPGGSGIAPPVLGQMGVAPDLGRSLIR